MEIVARVGKFVRWHLGDEVILHDRLMLEWRSPEQDKAAVVLENQPDSIGVVSPSEHVREQEAGRQRMELPCHIRSELLGNVDESFVESSDAVDGVSGQAGQQRKQLVQLLRVQHPPDTELLRKVRAVVGGNSIHFVVTLHR
jgi:hypothetical protein